jgi:hypothetical protein
MGLYAKLAAAMGRIEAVAKDGHNEHFNYDYVTESALTEAVRKALSCEKIAFFPTVVGITREDNMTRVEMDFTFADTDSEDKITVKFFGEAKDTSDKGIYKAYTGAVKYCLMKTFLISTDDDPENDGGKKPERKPEPRQGPKQEPQQAPDDPTGGMFGGTAADTGKPEQPEKPKLVGNPASTKQLNAIYAIIRELKITDEDAKKMLADRYKKDSSKNLTSTEASDMITYLKGLQEASA